MMFTTRPMTELDLEAVIAIEKTTHISPWGKEDIHNCIQIGYDCLVIEVHEHKKPVLIGYLIARLDQNECHLLNICIAKSWQYQGYGRKFLNQYITSLQNINYLILEVRPSNAVALHLYHTMGFKELFIKPEYYHDTYGYEDAIVLKKFI